ncbi:MAG: CHRD domain-containing protein [Lacipirellulaceae bacterium]
MRPMLCTLAVAALGWLGSVASAQSLVAVLNGAQEVGPVATTATGTATVNLSGGAGAWVAAYNIDYTGLQSVIVNPPGAHIHNAPAGINGSVVHFLDGVAGWVGTQSGTITGDWRWDDATNPLTDTLASAMLAGNLYFNIHTDLNRGGEIRGQIVPEPASVAMVAALFTPLAFRRRR